MSQAETPSPLNPLTLPLHGSRSGRHSMEASEK